VGIGRIYGIQTMTKSFKITTEHLNYSTEPDCLLPDDDPALELIKSGTIGDHTKEVGLDLTKLKDDNDQG